MAEPAREDRTPVRGHPKPEVVVGGLAGSLLVGLGTSDLAWPGTMPQPATGVWPIGVGAGLLLAIVWRDALVTMLAVVVVIALGAAVASPSDLGGAERTVVGGWSSAVVAVLLVVAAWWRWRRLGYVLGRVVTATTPALCHLVEQKTVLLETFRRDGTAVGTPVSIAIDGPRAVIRTFERAGKTRRLRRDPNARVTPCSGRGTPTGPPLRARCRRLEGGEARTAAGLLRRKYPLLHGLLGPLVHRAGRARTGRTVYFEVLPVAGPAISSSHAHLIADPEEPADVAGDATAGR